MAFWKTVTATPQVGIQVILGLGPILSAKWILEPFGDWETHTGMLQVT